jgi:hypothetical protein
MVIGNKAVALLSFGLLLGFSAPAWSAASARRREMLSRHQLTRMTTHCWASSTRL